MGVALLIDAFAALGAAFALWKGGPAERAAAVIVLANILFGLGSAWLAPSIEGVIRIVNDGLTALLLMIVTVRYGALWMGAVMFFYAAQFAMHSYYLVTGRKGGDYLHALINNINFMGIVLCLILGTAVAWRRRVRARAA